MELNYDTDHSDGVLEESYLTYITVYIKKKKYNVNPSLEMAQFTTCQKESPNSTHIIWNRNAAEYPIFYFSPFILIHTAEPGSWEFRLQFMYISSFFAPLN